MEVEIVEQITRCITAIALLVVSVFWLKLGLDFAKDTKPQPTVLERIFGKKDGE